MRNRELISVALAGLVPLVLFSSGCQQTRFHKGISNQTRKAPEIPSSTTGQAGSNAIQDQMRQLLLERKHLLERNAAEIKNSFQHGRESASDYVRARIAALLAGIDLCNTKAERIEIHNEVVKLWIELERSMEAEYRGGQLSVGGLNHVKIARLEAEMDLLKEQLNE